MNIFLRLALIGLGFAGPVATAGALDFQLSSVVVEEDGFKHEQLFFHRDDKTTVLISLPPGWARTADPESLTITLPAEPDTMVRLAKSPFTPDTPFKDRALETYQRRVIAAIPQGATEVQVREQRDEPLPIFHWKSHEFVVDYVFFGRAFRRSVIFVNLDAGEQIMVTAAATRASYEAAREVAFGVLRSWQTAPAS